MKRKLSKSIIWYDGKYYENAVVHILLEFKSKFVSSSSDLLVRLTKLEHFIESYADSSDLQDMKFHEWSLTYQLNLLRIYSRKFRRKFINFPFQLTIRTQELVYSLSICIFFESET